MKSLLSITLLLMANICLAQTEKFSADAETFYKDAMKTIYPAYKTRIGEEARKMKQRTPNKDSLVIAITPKNPNWSILGSMSGQDIEALAFLVLMQSAKSAQEDLKAIMTAVKSINKNKEAVRNHNTASSSGNQPGAADNTKKKSREQEIRDSLYTPQQQMEMQRLEGYHDQTARVLNEFIKKIKPNRAAIIRRLKTK